MVTDKRIDTADEAARGRYAESVGTITLKGWKDIGLRTFDEIGEDRLSIVSAGVAFFLLLALFPALTALVSLFGLVADPATIQTQLDSLAGILPASALEMVDEQLSRLVATNNSSLSIGFLAGLAIAIWSTMSGFKALFQALNVAYDEFEARGFLRLNLTALLFAFGAFFAIAVLVAVTIVVPAIIALLPLGQSAEAWLNVLRWPLLLIVIAVAICALYRWGPSRNPARWRWVAPGAIVASAAWVAFSAAFSFYLANFANYDAVYGSLGAVIGVMMWVYLSVFIMLVGAELNSETEHQLIVDTTIGPHKSMGARGARMADTIGEAR